MRCAEKSKGGTDASATRTFDRPYTRSWASTTPPRFFGSIAQVEEGWYSVKVWPRSQSAHSSSVWTRLGPGQTSLVVLLLSGEALPRARAYLRAETRICTSASRGLVRVCENEIGRRRLTGWMPQVCWINQGVVHGIGGVDPDSAVA